MFKFIIIIILIILVESVLIRVAALAFFLVDRVVFNNQLVLTEDDYKKPFYLTKYRDNYEVRFTKNNVTEVITVGNSNVDLKPFISKQIYIKGKYPVNQSEQCIKNNCHSLYPEISSANAIIDKTIHIYSAKEKTYSFKDCLWPF